MYYISEYYVCMYNISEYYKHIVLQLSFNCVAGCLTSERSCPLVSRVVDVMPTQLCDEPLRLADGDVGAQGRRLGRQRRRHLVAVERKLRRRREAQQDLEDEVRHRFVGGERRVDVSDDRLERVE